VTADLTMHKFLEYLPGDSGWLAGIALYGDDDHVFIAQRTIDRDDETVDVAVLQQQLEATVLCSYWTWRESETKGGQK
jgi:hypothetical protein